MAVHTYGTTNISFSSFDIWSNGVSSDSNVTMNNALTDAAPANSNPTAASEIYNNNWFYGSLQVSTGGYVDVSAGSYSLTDVSTTTTLKNHVNVNQKIQSCVKLRIIDGCRSIERQHQNRHLVSIRPAKNVNLLPPKRKFTTIFSAYCISCNTHFSTLEYKIVN